MRAIVTTDARILSKDYAGYIKVRSIKDLFDKPEVTEVVVHTMDEKPFQAGLDISELNKQRETLRIVYLNDNPQSMLQIIINGIGGTCIDDLFYFDSVEDLNSLFDEFAIVNPQEAAIQGNIGILQGFIEEFARTNGDVSQFYITRAQNALVQLRNDTNIQIQQVKEVGGTAIEVLGNASEYLSKMTEQHKMLQKQIEALELSANSPRNTFGGGAAGAFFPTVRLSTSALAMCKVLFIREYSHCRYLTSLLIAYRYYLQYCKNKRVKLVFAVPRGQGIASKYDFATMITLESMRETSLYAGSILAVNVPQKVVIERIFGKDGGNNDIVIFVDRLYAGNDIIQGDSMNFKKLCAVSGNSDIKRYNLRVQNCIMTQVGMSGKEFCCIPHFKSFPASEERRLSTYQQMCTSRDEKTDIFLRFDKLLGI